MAGAAPRPAYARQKKAAQTASKRAAARANVSADSRADVARFRAQVEQILGSDPARRACWGILVTDWDTGAVLFQLNADRFFIPASNAKLFTTAFALGTLGPNYRFRTTLESDGALGAEGRLSGNLILVGRGDPDLSNRKFPPGGRAEHDGPVDKVLGELADQAVANGLREVDGDLIADDSFLPYDPYPAGWSSGDLFFAFAPPISAIGFNDNAFSVELIPGVHAGQTPVLSVDPPAAAGTFGYELRTSAGGEPSVAVVRQPGPNFILLRGTIPAGHALVRVDLAMAEPAEIAARALRQALEARGVRVSGQVSVQHAPPPITTAAGDPVIPPGFSPLPAPHRLTLAEHLSPPLIESVHATNKLSLNLHAELFLRTAAREKTGLGSEAMGLKLEREFLQRAGIAEGDVILSDGAGLARDDLVAPRAIVQLLGYVRRQSWGGEFADSLSIAGVDGTLENRLKDAPAAGLIHAKTGSLEHVHSIAGYATTARGEALTFAIFVNNSAIHGPDSTAALDSLCQDMVATLGARAPRRRK